MIDLYECDIYYNHFICNDYNDIVKKENKINNIIYIDEQFTKINGFDYIKIEYIDDDNILQTIIDKNIYFRFLVKSTKE